MVGSPYHRLILLLLLAPGWLICPSYSQDFRGELRDKLNPWDLKLLDKARENRDKGTTIRACCKTSADTVDSESYYRCLLEGANYFIYATEYESEVLHRNILLLSSKYSGDQMILDTLSQLQNTAYDSLYSADRFRSKIRTRMAYEKQALLTMQAEATERDALLSLAKVLYTYLTLPQEPHYAWLHSKDSLPPYASANKQLQPLQNEQLTSLTDNKPSIYANLQVEEKDVDKFNGFLEKNKPELMESILVEKKMPAQEEMKDLQDDWKNYNQPGSKPEQTKALISLKKEPAAAKFVYKVQVAACRTKLSPLVVKKIYRGPEPVVETFEDNWFKYTIGGYDSYAEAKILKLNCQVKQAFIVSYLNGKRFKITMSMVRAR